MRYRLLRRIRGSVQRLRKFNSGAYWEDRYARGRDSGSGSTGRLADFKARTINAFVEENDIESVTEFGCGDGEQLKLARYTDYVGLDASATAVSRCIDRLSSESQFSFYLYSPMAFHDKKGLFVADLTLSIDVLFHLVEDDVFHKYMQDLFGSARRFVVIYSSNMVLGGQAPHVRHREFTKWIDEFAPDWRLQSHIKNPYPFDPKDPSRTSHCDFWMFRRLVE